MRTARQRIAAVVAVAVLGIAGSLAAISPAQASGWVTPQHFWSAFGTSAHVHGEAFGHDFGCGLKDCADGSDLYFQAGRLSGASVDQSRVNAVVSFGGTGLNVSVSVPLGVGVGFTDGGSSCNHGYWSAPGNWVSVDLGGGVICETDTWGWVSNMRLGTTGAVRDGGNWSARSASACVSMGGGGR